MSGKAFPEPPLLSNVFVRVSVSVFGRFEGVEEMHRFYPVDTVEHLINLQWD